MAALGDPDIASASATGSCCQATWPRPAAPQVCTIKPIRRTGARPEVTHDQAHPRRSLRRPNFRQGGPWDVQRIGSDRDPTHKFIDYATVGIGLYGAAAGIPIDELPFYQNLYAAHHSDFGDVERDPVYTHLAQRNVKNTRRGYELYNSGQIGPSSTK
jgi:hypothetical protein